MTQALQCHIRPNQIHWIHHRRAWLATCDGNKNGDIKSRNLMPISPAKPDNTAWICSPPIRARFLIAIAQVVESPRFAQWITLYAQSPPTNGWQVLEIKARPPTASDNKLMRGWMALAIAVSLSLSLAQSRILVLRLRVTVNATIRHWAKWVFPRQKLDRPMTPV